MKEQDKEDIAKIVMKYLFKLRADLDKELFNIDEMLLSLIDVKLTEEEILLGELARLMTLMHLHEDREEYEKAAVIQRKVNDVNNRLDNIQKDD
tara:strand:+ start:1236 stop:1517 length:282 start_codon:yes stop_codon:yes gene_type:complete